MDESCRVKIFKCSCDLADDISRMNVLQDSLADDVVQIGLHVLKDEIDVLTILCLYGIV